jgi:hypothetical protein
MQRCARWGQGGVVPKSVSSQKSSGVVANSVEGAIVQELVVAWLGGCLFRHVLIRGQLCHLRVNEEGVPAGSR